MARILVIDDESNIRMMIRLALQHVGHTVEAAADGQEGLARFNERADWDLILLDYRMPGLDGMDVLKQIRWHDPHARVVMITAFGTIDLAVEALKAGATDFLPQAVYRRHSARRGAGRAQKRSRKANHKLLGLLRKQTDRPCPLPARRSA